MEKLDFCWFLIFAFMRQKLPEPIFSKTVFREISLVTFYSGAIKKDLVHNLGTFQKIL